MRIKTVRDFYSNMQRSSRVRRRLVRNILEGEALSTEDMGFLKSLHATLKTLPDAEGFVRLEADRKSISFKIDYEFDELAKDLLFLEKGEEALLAHMAELHPGFQEELEGALTFCRRLHLPLGCLFTDRDGTVNNYCGRYLSSIQSAYNAVFLSRFARQAVGKAVILTSAPLSDGGLEDLTVSPSGTFVLAGSKGREYLDEHGRRGSLAIEADKQQHLERLNRRLGKLLEDPGYELFALIGSGLQFKFGQTTVARQDIYGSVPEAESEAFVGVIRELICELDPDGQTFRIEDTGKDIEIILTVEGASGLKDFDKGDGILFLDSELGLGLGGSQSLICGDTASDIPMVKSASELSPDPWTIFVTRDANLEEAVRRTSKRSHFVSEPDVLVCCLNQLGKERQ